MLDICDDIYRYLWIFFGGTCKGIPGFYLFSLLTTFFFTSLEVFLIINLKYFLGNSFNLSSFIRFYRWFFLGQTLSIKYFVLQGMKTVKCARITVEVILSIRALGFCVHDFLRMKKLLYAKLFYYDCFSLRSFCYNYVFFTLNYLHVLVQMKYM